VVCTFDRKFSISHCFHAIMLIRLQGLHKDVKGAFILIKDLIMSVRQKGLLLSRYDATSTTRRSEKAFLILRHMILSAMSVSSWSGRSECFLHPPTSKDHRPCSFIGWDSCGRIWRNRRLPSCRRKFGLWTERYRDGGDGNGIRRQYL